MFITEAYGGKCSDRFITQSFMGLSTILRAGVEVMGGRGFTIWDLLEQGCQSQMDGGPNKKISYKTRAGLFECSLKNV